MAVIKGTNPDLIPSVVQGKINIQGTPRQFGANLGDQAGDIERIQAQRPAARAATNASDAAAWRSVGNSVMQIGLRKQALADRIALGEVLDVMNTWNLDNKKSEGILARTGYGTRGIFEDAEERKKELEALIKGIGDDRISLRKEELLRNNNATLIRMSIL